MQNINTPYDDVFKTLLNDCTELVIPLLNEVFHESYDGTEEIQFYPNEHFLNRKDGQEVERITDSCFVVKGNSSKFPIQQKALRAIMHSSQRRK